MFDDAEGMGSWEAYFEAVYQRVDKKMLDEDKKRYQGTSFSPSPFRLHSAEDDHDDAGSEEETQDLYTAYTTHSGSLAAIMSHIPHSTPADEPRFIKLINDAIFSGTLDALPAWKKSSTDTKARDSRARKAKREEKEAEGAARELGVWDEFYGDGKSSKPANGKRGTKRKDGEGEEDVSGLAALIAKRQTSRASAFDALLAKYGGGAAEEDEEVIESSGKRGGKTKKGGKRTKEDMSEEAGMPVCFAFGVLGSGMLILCSVDGGRVSETSREDVQGEGGWHDGEGEACKEGGEMIC